MQSTITILCVLEAFHNGGVLVEFLFLDSYVYSDDVLPDYTSSTYVQMTTGEPVFIGKFCKMQ